MRSFGRNGTHVYNFFPEKLFDNKPDLLSKIYFTAASLDNIVMMTSQFSINSCGLFAAMAPASIKAISLSLDRFYTATLKPAFNKLRTIGFPIFPRPIQPIFKFVFIFYYISQIINCNRSREFLGRYG
jgi:hypothetical protein